jgi:hypothetical protein
MYKQKPKIEGERTQRYKQKPSSIYGFWLYLCVLSPSSIYGSCSYLCVLSPSIYGFCLYLCGLSPSSITASVYTFETEAVIDEGERTQRYKQKP